MFPLFLRLEAFTRLAQDDRSALERMSLRTRDIPPRRDLIREGERPKHAFLMMEGWACRYKALPDGRRQIVSFFVPGDICDMHIRAPKEMDHSIAAITPLKVAEAGLDEFEQLTASHPRILQALYRDALIAASIQREWTLNIGQRTAYERLAHLICELFLRLQAAALVEGKSCHFPLTQADLAEATGLTAVHVNRTLQELRRDGLFELQSKILTVPDLHRLQEAAMFNGNYLHFERHGGPQTRDD